jgi:hypothetical protein
MYYLEHPSIKAKHFWHCTVLEVSRRATLLRCIFPSLLIYRFVIGFSSLSKQFVFAAIDLIEICFPLHVEAQALSSFRYDSGLGCSRVSDRIPQVSISF